jgi:hypothetical protein
MRKKPTFIYVTSVLFLLTPVLFNLSIFLNAPTRDDYLIALGDPTAVLFCFACWTAAASTWRVQMWGYFSYFLSTSLILLLELQRFIFSEPDSLAVSPHLNIIILSLGTLLYRVQLLTEPFMNPQSRWWETSARYNVDLHANIRGRKEDLKVRLLDISETGFFVEHPEKLAVGSIFGVDIYFQKSKIHAVGMVVRNSVRPAGVGFTFLAATRSEKSAVKQLIQALEAAAMGATPLPIIVDDDQDQDQIAA